MCEGGGREGCADLAEESEVDLFCCSVFFFFFLVFVSVVVVAPACCGVVVVAAVGVRGRVHGESILKQHFLLCVLQNRCARSTRTFE